MNTYEFIIKINEVEKALLKKKKQIEKYFEIMNTIDKTNVYEDKNFRTKFNGFYRIRQRSPEFYNEYYLYLEKNKNNKVIKYDDILNHFYNKFGRIEKSFSSKLLATINPNMPVWDSIVLSKLDMKVPTGKDKFQETIKMYYEIVDWYEEYFKTDQSKQVINIFDKVFQNKNITDIKKVDLVLWSIRGKKESDFNDKIKGSIFGFIVGDALGVPVEFSKREYLEKNPVSEMLENKERRTTKGYWSDDTAMTLCTMEAISESKSITAGLHEEILDKYLKWVEEGYMAVNNICFGIGQTVFKSLLNYKKSKTFMQYMMSNNPETDRNGGNGALMRILPLILYLYYNDIERYKKSDKKVQKARKYDFIETEVTTTHNSKLNYETCSFYTMFVFNLLDTEDLVKAYKLSTQEHLERFGGCQDGRLERIINNKLIDSNINEIKSSGFVIDTLEASLWCLFNTNSYDEAVLKAVNLGGDTDTIAAITGSLAGLYYEYNSIPKKWLNELCEKKLLDKVIEDFITKVQGGKNEKK